MSWMINLYGVIRDSIMTEEDTFKALCREPFLQLYYKWVNPVHDWDAALASSGWIWKDFYAEYERRKEARSL